MTLLGGRIVCLLAAIAAGIVVAVIGANIGFNSAYIRELSSAWKIFAGWFPVIIIILGLITSNSDKEFIKAIAKHGLAAWLIDDVIICAFFILFSSVSLFLHSLSSPPFWGTFACTVIAVATIIILIRISWQIFKVAKHIAIVESNKDSKKQ